ncbi:MAG: OmpA family protein [Gammaproteobacteria bacterium]|nr:OmpA family protein [Gammaproteobacteria bacterium]
MKKFVGIALPAAIAGLLAVSPQAVAADGYYAGTEDISVGLRLHLSKYSNKRVHVDGMGNVTPFSNSLQSPQPGLEIQVPLTKRWAVRSYYDYVEVDASNSQNTGYGRMMGSDALFFINHNWYVGLGLNQTKIQQHRDRMFRGTVGYRHQVADRLFMKAEFAAQTESDFNDQSFILGMAYTFGNSGPLFDNTRDRSRAAQVVEEPTEDRTTDTDGDGVPDYRDECPNTPRGHVVDSRGCTVYTTQQVSEELRVGFAFDSARVTSDYQGGIRRLADFMKEHPDTQVVLHGHTDLIGTAEYNQRLSERRAAAVRDILVNEHGIARSRIQTRGHGMSQPVVNEISLPANARNRRTEARLSVEIRVPQTR